MNFGKALLLFSFGMFAVRGIAQPSNFTDSDYWKHQRKEFIFGLGATNFLGDLGGLNRIGTDYSVVDLEPSLTRPGLHIGYRYRLRPFILTKWMFQYSLLRGDDALTNEPYRHYRNLNFRTHLFELTEHFEFVVYSSEYFGRRYKIKGLKGMRNKNTLLYLFTGFSGFIYIPQGFGLGDWHNLRPLHTEGQGLQNGPAPYKLFNFGVPFGLGLKIGLDALWRMSFELSYTKTFTDYLDDVSTIYYDPSVIEQHYGALAGYFADPSTGEFATWTAPGQIRGDADDLDAYLYINVSFIRNVTYKRSGKLKFQYRARF